jgi:membrane protein
VAFLGLLALFPAMVAITALYGLVADPSSIGDTIKPFAALLPASAQNILFSQLAV